MHNRCCSASQLTCNMLNTRKALVLTILAGKYILWGRTASVPLPLSPMLPATRYSPPVMPLLYVCMSGGILVQKVVSTVVLFVKLPNKLYLCISAGQIGARLDGFTFVYLQPGTLLFHCVVLSHSTIIAIQLLLQTHIPIQLTPNNPFRYPPQTGIANK